VTGEFGFDRSSLVSNGFCGRAGDATVLGVIE
jgi:hypothetical protein